MTKFQLNRPDAPWDYPRHGFRADAGDAILDGSTFDPPITTPPDIWWTVYTGGLGETGITRYTFPVVPGSSPVEPTDGAFLTYSDSLNTYVPSPAVSVFAAGSDVTMTTVDANAASAFRAQQDARLLATDDNAASALRTQQDARHAATYVKRAHAPVYAESHGVVANGSTDDGAALAAAIAAAGSGGTVILPAGNVKVTSPVQITTSVTLMGSGGFYASRIYAVGCGGIEVAAGVTDFHVIGLEIAAASRYADAPNAFIGIKVSGGGGIGERPENHVYRDVYVDGFNTAFQSTYLWASNFDNFRCYFGLRGIDSYGLSVNNMVNNCHIVVQQISGSVGIRLNGQVSPADPSVLGSEGWVITNSLIYGGDVGVSLIGNTHCHIAGNIIDFCGNKGVYVVDNGTNLADNHLISGNYIAMQGVGGSGAVVINNSVANAAYHRANRITDNHMITYAGASAANGVYLVGAESQSIISGNVIDDFTYDINLVCGGNIVTGNQCLSTISTHTIRNNSGLPNLVANNVGLTYLNGGNPNVYSVNALGRKEWVGLQAHTTGTHALGDHVRNPYSTVGQPKGWFCTVAGTPGTWVSEGNL